MSTSVENLKLFTVQELAKLCQVSDKTIYHEIERQRVVRVGRCVRITRAAVDKYLAQQAVA